MEVNNKTEHIAIVPRSEDMGGCLFAIPVIKKLRSLISAGKFVVFIVHTRLFESCSYVHEIYDFHNSSKLSQFEKHIVLFGSTDLIHSSMDTFDYTGDWKPVMENVAKVLKEMAINHEH